MSCGQMEPVLVPPAADEAPVQELARRQGVRPVNPVDDMARPSESIGVCPIECTGVAARVAAPRPCGPVTSMVQAAGIRRVP